MNKRLKGLYRKFDVRRTDGRDVKGQKHYSCRYFVLDLDHDPFAIPALDAYQDACKDEYPALACNLLSLVSGLRDGLGITPPLERRFKRKEPK